MGLVRVERDCSRQDYVQYRFNLGNLDEFG